MLQHQKIRFAMVPPGRTTVHAFYSSGLHIQLRVTSA